MLRTFVFHLVFRLARTLVKLRMTAPAAPARDWAVPLMAWPGCCRFLYTFTLWPLAASEVARRASRPSPFLCDGCGGGVIGCLLCLCWVPWGLTREQLRAQRRIDGALVNDLCLSLFCPPCILAQELAELDAAAAATAAAAVGAGGGGTADAGARPQMAMR